MKSSATVLTPEFWMDKFGDWFIPEPNSGCWLWMRCVPKTGYGMLTVQNACRLAHRVSWEMLRGPIPKGMQIDHLCRTRSCVNPDHLEVVTQRENIIRGNGWGGRNARATECPKGHRYDEVNTGWDAPNRRFCKACRRAHHTAYQKLYRERKRAGA